MMPGLDGHQVLEQLRKDPATATLPFIFLTAKSDETDLRTGMNLGADDYLTKPVSREDLLFAIEVRLGRRRAHQAEVASAKSSSGFKPSYDSPKLLESLGLTPREAEVLLWVAQGKAMETSVSFWGWPRRRLKSTWVTFSRSSGWKDATPQHPGFGGPQLSAFRLSKSLSLLNLHSELPRGRTFVASLRLIFKLCESPPPSLPHSVR